jgi:CRISPR-associated protein Cas5d
MSDPPAVCVKVWGSYACFTRPELKVERLSYPVMTPSAARGVLDAILFRPEMRWHVRRITVLRPWWLPDDPERPPYQFVAVRRNEIQDKVAPRTVAAWMADPACFEPYLVDSAGRESVGGANRTQRNTLALRDVAYLIHATPRLTDKPARASATPSDAGDPPEPNTVAKYVGMFQRRVEKGQCFHRPYLGCREFACHFATADGSEQPVTWSEYLGLMLYDLRFGDNGDNVPGFFHARINAGVLHCDTADAGPNGEPPVTVLGWDGPDRKEPTP